ncbi:TIGR04028 family ABC transporter substrate-binding protein [Microbacterium excoecariae]|uniref:TIGR04028 family ABC transporter substrate-binding protein n=1 Tax=Microbacterium excoecariae TaxID=2715210 RepID=UPI00140A3719|nr:TIGR04028 family ABC transporter substrate-binding protein [Microbacterium excoecariae]NHI15702.1 TIGR04028 family ABC transporter substrate-binding protein [Microbacterium excoecariae]
MSRFPRIALAAVSMAAAVGVLAGCSGGAAPAGSAGNGEPQQGGTLTYLEPQTWLTLYSPAGGFYPNGGVINNITDRLLYQDPDTLELEPWIAEDWSVNEDATEYTFTLREGVTYSDGSPLDAENVVRNIDLFGLGDADRALTVSEAINNYERGEVVDDRTVRFFFSAPAPGFAQAVSTINSGLLSSATLERTSEEFGPGNATEIIGSGPFVIADEEIGTALSLEAREDYDWAPPSFAHQGRAYLDAIEILVVPEDSVRVGTVATQQAHIARQVEAPDEAQFDAEGLSLLAASTNGVNNGLSFRFRDPLLEDVRVRQALIAAIDREEIVETLFTDSYPLATGALAESALGYVDTSEYYVHDVEEATRLLDEAGWEIGSDGIREKDGEKLALTFNEALPQPRSREVITLVREQLREVGVEVSLLPGDQAAQDAARAEVGALQVYHSMVGRADYDVLKSQYSSANRDALLNGYPDGSVGDEELDALLDEIASASTEEGRIEASAAAQQRLADQAYILPFFEEPQVFGYIDTVGGFRTESVGRPAFYDTWLAG